jgi:hypothetical protein
MVRRDLRIAQDQLAAARFAVRTAAGRLLRLTQELDELAGSR